jgi:hypothetical protein
VEKKAEEGGTTDPMANKTFVITAILVRLLDSNVLPNICLLEPSIHNAGGIS